MSEQEVGALLSVALTFVFFAWILWSFVRGRRVVDEGVPDGRVDEEYRVFTRKYDLEVLTRDAVAHLAKSSPDRFKGWTLRDPSIWRTYVAKAQALYNQALFLQSAGSEEFAQSVVTDWTDVAVSFLIDHSGSMKGNRAVACAAAVRSLSEQLESSGARTEVLGYSTAGWHGGNAAKAWRNEGSPSRPGRLCALLHLIHKPTGEKWRQDDWEAMLHPDLYRENVDGEAIEWACARLQGAGQQKKILVVISDGAPVDDTTLMYNGPTYLRRNLAEVVTQMADAQQIALAALGIGYRVDEIYEFSRWVEDVAELPEVLRTLIYEALADYWSSVSQ